MSALAREVALQHVSNEPTFLERVLIRRASEPYTSLRQLEVELGPFRLPARKHAGRPAFIRPKPTGICPRCRLSMPRTGGQDVCGRCVAKPSKYGRRWER